MPTIVSRSFKFWDLKAMNLANWGEEPGDFSGSTAVRSSAGSFSSFVSIGDRL